MTIILESGSPYLNPYMVEVKDGEWRGVKEIRIFNERGIAHKLRWFIGGTSKSVPVEFEGLKLVRKGKENFTKMYRQGKAFWIPKPKEYFEKHYDHNFCILYLPINKIDLREVSRKKTSYEHSHDTWDDVLFSVSGGTGFFRENENYRQSAKNKKNEMINELIGKSSFKDISYDIIHNFDELKALLDRIQEIKEGKE